MLPSEGGGVAARGVGGREGKEEREGDTKFKSLFFEGLLGVGDAAVPAVESVVQFGG